jgi:hypothetical protein
MNKDNAHLYLSLVQALADGKEIQQKIIGTNEWMDVIAPYFTESADKYRIKQEPRKSWYRVARKPDGVMICGPEQNKTEEEIEGEYYFVAWITDRVEYEIPEK